MLPKNCIGYIIETMIHIRSLLWGPYSSFSDTIEKLKIFISQLTTVHNIKKMGIVKNRILIEYN